MTDDTRRLSPSSGTLELRPCSRSCLSSLARFPSASVVSASVPTNGGVVLAGDSSVRLTGNASDMRTDTPSGKSTSLASSGIEISCSWKTRLTIRISEDLTLGPL